MFLSKTLSSRYYSRFANCSAIKPNQLNYYNGQHFLRVSLSTATPPQNPSYDYIISGGGAIGAGLAASLLEKTKGSCKIAIIEFSKKR